MLMRNLYLPTIVALSFFTTHCASSKKASPGVYVNHQQLNGRTFHKLFVEVETVDVQLRAMLETDLVEALTLGGYAGVKSIDLIPFSLKELKLPTEEEIRLKVKESGCDGILFISVLRKGESLEYTPGTVRKENEQWGAGILGGVLNKGGAGGQVKAIPPVNTDGSYSHTAADFILRNNLYDVPAHVLMLSIQSDHIDISTLDKTGKTYAAALVVQLKDEKLLK